MVARRDQDRPNGADRDDNNLFRNHDYNDANQGRLEQIAGEAGNHGVPENRSFGSRYKEYFLRNFDGESGLGAKLRSFGNKLKEVGEGTGTYFKYLGCAIIWPYVIPTANAVDIFGEGDNSHQKAAVAGFLTGITVDAGQLIFYVYMTFKDIAPNDPSISGRINWEYAMIPVATNVVDYLFVEPLRKTMNDIKNERNENR
jgi:hypothetical protein